MTEKTKRSKKLPFDAALERLEKERENYRKNSAKSPMRTKAARSVSPSKNKKPTNGNSDNDVSEAGKLRKERNELRNLLDKYEIHLSDIQASVKGVIRERDSAQEMYTKAKEELKSLRREVMKSAKHKSSLPVQSMLRDIENDRDRLARELQIMSSENDTLREKLRMSKHTLTSEKARALDEENFYAQKIGNLERKNEDAEKKLKDLEKTGSRYEEELRNQSLRLTKAKEENVDAKSQNTQVKFEVELLTRDLAECQAQLSRKSSALVSLEEHHHSLERQHHELQITTSQYHQDNIRLKTIIEKQELEIAELNAQVHRRSHELTESRFQTEQKQRQACMTHDELHNKDKVIKSLEVTLTGLEDTIKQLQREDQAKGTSISGLTSKCNDLMRKCQELDGKLFESSAQLEATLNNIEQLDHEVIHLNDVIRSQGEEAKRMQRQIEELQKNVQECERDLCIAEAERAETVQCKNEVESKLEITLDDNKRLQLENRSLDETIGRMQTENCRMDERITKQTTTINNLQAEMKQQEFEKHNILTDLNIARDHIRKLSADIEDKIRELGAKCLECDQIANQCEDLRQDVAVLKKHQANLKEANGQMEEKIAGLEENIFSNDLLIQEKEAEIQLFNEKIQLMEAKCNNQLREVQTLRSRIAKNEHELVHTQRNLTQERFERDKLEHDLLRIRNCSLPRCGNRVHSPHL